MARSLMKEPNMSMSEQWKLKSVTYLLTVLALAYCQAQPSRIRDDAMRTNKEKTTTAKQPWAGLVRVVKSVRSVQKPSCHASRLKSVLSGHK
ncbi:hypothetical protein F5Y17DRAFT_225030 [Xylariaceae sp. FL0594]|nr:hypothetical protein F5Y17DRAFT_225030 [Xylariaceae sp. FL0594]